MDVIISRRSRNLAYGWSTAVEEYTTQHGSRASRIRRPAPPREQGGLRTLRRQMHERYRICGHSTYYSEGVFVGGRRCRAYDPGDGHWYEIDPKDLIAMLEDQPGALRVRLDEGGSGA